MGSVTPVTSAYSSDAFKGQDEVTNPFISHSSNRGLFTLCQQMITSVAVAVLPFGKDEEVMFLHPIQMLIKRRKEEAVFAGDKTE